MTCLKKAGSKSLSFTPPCLAGSALSCRVVRLGKLPTNRIKPLLLQSSHQVWSLSIQNPQKKLKVGWRFFAKEQRNALGLRSEMQSLKAHNKTFKIAPLRSAGTRLRFAPACPLTLRYVLIDSPRGVQLCRDTQI